MYRALRLARYTARTHALTYLQALLAAVLLDVLVDPGGAEALLGAVEERQIARDRDAVVLEGEMRRLVALVVGPCAVSETKLGPSWDQAETKLAQPSVSWLSPGRLLSAPDHAPGHPELRPASAKQPALWLGQRWPAIHRYTGHTGHTIQALLSTISWCR